MMRQAGVTYEPSDYYHHYSTPSASSAVRLPAVDAASRLPPPFGLKPSSRPGIPSSSSSPAAVAVAASAPRYHVSQPHPASSARLPRSSSLLPAPRLAPTTFYSHSPDTTPRVAPNRPRTPPQHQDAPFIFNDHLDPSSAYDAALSNGGSHYQRHRWSASTGSSHTSVLPPRAPSGRPGRRASIDATAFLADSPPSSRPSPRRLHKSRRPSTSSAYQAARTPIEPTEPLPFGLPPLAPLPSLEQTIPSTNHYNSSQQKPGARAPRRDISQPSSLDSAVPRSSSAMASSRVGMAYDEPIDPSQIPRGHSRQRSGHGSNDSARARAKAPSQKAMLSRALQKANTAVQLDNAQNFEGARAAYAEACDLLQQVLQRTSADDDKRKLEAIHRTYTSRILELDQMGPWQAEAEDTKALPARPESDGYGLGSSMNLDDDPDEVSSDEVEEETPVIIETATVTRIIKDESAQSPPRPEPARLAIQTNELGLLQSSFSKSPISGRTPSMLLLQTNADPSQLPPPLSPFRPPPSPRTYFDTSNVVAHSDFTQKPKQPEVREFGHVRGDSQNSWLDPIDESGGSTGSSVHSHTSSFGYRRRQLRTSRDETEVEFDTALDAAIEAAYDEGYEPMDHNSHNPDFGEPGEEVITDPLRRVELARERVRQTEREAYEMANELGVQLQQRQDTPLRSPLRSPADFYVEDSSEDEERLLEEMTRDYKIQNFSMQQPPKSTYLEPGDAQSGRSWQSSATILPPPSITPLSSIAETPPQQFPKAMTPLPPSPPAPPPTGSLPEVPPPKSQSQSVRNRRLSGQNPKQLVIHTAIPNPSKGQEAVQKPTVAPQDAEPQLEEASDSFATRRPSTPLAEEPSPTDMRGLDSPFRNRSNGADDDAGIHASPPEKLRKNFSSSSLRSMKSRNMSVSQMENGSDLSPSTPSSAFFGNARAPAVPALPTPLAAAFRNKPDGLMGSMSLFDDDFHGPASPGSPNPASLDAPVPLEPCPMDSMLRPFWLMRCLYQTLVHPRGGYLSTKLFVPRDAWKVKGVKLKNMEDKISNCDYLTAALLKLAKVDTYDADAVLEEMQSFEGVLEEVQSGLSRKLGNEVGVQGSGTFFNQAGGATEGNSASNMPRSASVSAKSGSSSFSWRRLRSKNSGVGLGAGANGRTAIAEGGKDIVSMPTLPMTPQPTSRPPKRDVALAQFVGPNAHYMSSLARLFDAVQVIDQIARQVDDPGLRHADKTQVGLELCTRHAAEFFGFYICRFVLADLSLLIDKFIKRGSEWVLA